MKRGATFHLSLSLGLSNLRQNDNCMILRPSQSCLLWFLLSYMGTKEGCQSYNASTERTLNWCSFIQTTVKDYVFLQQIDRQVLLKKPKPKQTKKPDLFQINKDFQLKVWSHVEPTGRG